MEHKESNAELKDVMREADDLLEQLDASPAKPGPPIPPHRLETKQNSGQEQNPRMKTVSKEMLARLKAIDKLASQGYQVRKIWDAIPGLVGSSGIDKSVLVSSPAGFSWIAFFFPFAVCAQIKEWSYFYVAGSLFLAGSVFYRASGWDPSYVISLAIAYQYGFYFPYLRWLSIQNNKPELDKGSSIILGLVLGFACIIPSMVFEAIFISD
ncbi:hypothetical protein KBZ15_03735 [Cyanobium sp. BA20m-p-22]|uniref:hypothetical protein n=1 Tax=Cyanobium sp. BA20m-p-22 TaxID=2823704 RepID=UPI0020CF135D|nr:hypothetical protein [Cyanobium sp. BA20m-p-22]MCP9909028.1 hypothetical protein [Cyanobium sp. BA20m-p-22]